MTIPAGPGPHRPIRVLVVYDQELVRSGFCFILDTAEGITVVGEAANGEAALSAPSPAISAVVSPASVARISARCRDCARHLPYRAIGVTFRTSALR